MSKNPSGFDEIIFLCTVKCRRLNVAERLTT